MKVRKCRDFFFGKTVLVCLFSVCLSTGKAALDVQGQYAKNHISTHLQHGSKEMKVV